jgi:hypothetical protein
MKGHPAVSIGIENRNCWQTLAVANVDVRSGPADVARVPIDTQYTDVSIAMATDGGGSRHSVAPDL